MKATECAICVRVFFKQINFINRRFFFVFTMHGNPFLFDLIKSKRFKVFRNSSTQRKTVCCWSVVLNYFPLSIVAVDEIHIQFWFNFCFHLLINFCVVTFVFLIGYMATHERTYKMSSQEKKNTFFSYLLSSSL